MAKGACVAGGMHSRGCVWWGGACLAAETATAANGTPPTGMHSCFRMISFKMPIHV